MAHCSLAHFAVTEVLIKRRSINFARVGLVSYIYLTVRCLTCLLCAVESKLRDLENMKSNLISKLDLAYSMELMKIPPVSGLLQNISVLHSEVFFC